jgi:hypothetical protein
MSVVTLEGLVEDGRIRLLDGATLPDKTRVYVLVPGAALQPPRLRSPRLADPRQASEFTMRVTELHEDPTDAELRRR